MTNTAMELWFDDAFLVKRLKEQEQYLLDLQLRLWESNMPYSRYEELRDTAYFIKLRIEHQLSRPHPSEMVYDRVLEHK